MPYHYPVSECPHCGSSGLAGDLGQPVWLKKLWSTAKKRKKVWLLVKAGRIGWKAGRAIDKATGKYLGKEASTYAAEFMHKKLGPAPTSLQDFHSWLVRHRRRLPGWMRDVL